LFEYRRTLRSRGDVCPLDRSLLMGDLMFGVSIWIRH
jgi:hypothetical protein